MRSVKAITIAQAEGAFNRIYPATVLPAQEVALSFRISAQIIELPMRAAKEVKKGDILARLDIRDLENNGKQLQSQLEQAEAQLRAMTDGARAEDVASLQAAVDAAQAQVDAAQQQLERSQTLFKKGVVTKTKLDHDSTSLRVAKADLEAKKQELIKGKAGARIEDVQAQQAAIKGLRAQLEAVQNNISDATLRAPFAGIIASRAVENFANVQAKEQVGVLQRLNRLDLTFDIPGQDVTRFSKDEEPKAFAMLDALPGRKFDVELVDFTTQADPANQTFQARVSIEPPKDVTILPGVTGEISVSERTPSASLMQIPLTAITSNPDGYKVVWVVTADNKVTKRAVETGSIQATQIDVIKGLKAGETIAVAGLSSLQEGMSVKPVSKIGE